MNPSLLRVVLFAAVCLTLLCRIANTQSPANQSPFTLPFELIDNRVFVEVYLNGKGPYHFILDTGAVASTNDRVAQQLGLKVEDAGEGTGVGETKVRYGRTQIAQMTMGGLTLSNVNFDVIGGHDDSDQVFGLKPVDGIIGAPIFEQMVVKHDYVQRRLTCTPPQDFIYSGSGIELYFERPRQIPVVRAELDGITGNFGVDTGARTALLLYGPFCTENRLQEKYGAKMEGVTGWGIGGPVRSLLARARELKIGDVKVRDLVIRLSTQKAGLTTSSTMAGLIGPDVLSQFDVTFDYSRSRLIFEKNAQYGRGDSYDRLGVWMGQKGSAFNVVDVIAGGPADQAGLRVGDTILAIDGVDAAKLILPEVRESMRRRPPGSRITLVFESQGKRHTALLKLRDLV